MFEVGRNYIFFTCDDLNEGVARQGGKVIEVDGPLIKVSHGVPDVFDILNTHAPQFVRAELINYDPLVDEDDDIPDDLIAQPKP